MLLISFTNIVSNFIRAFVTILQVYSFRIRMLNFVKFIRDDGKSFVKRIFQDKKGILIADWTRQGYPPLGSRRSTFWSTNDRQRDAQGRNKKRLTLWTLRYFSQTVWDQIAWKWFLLGLSVQDELVACVWRLLLFLEKREERNRSKLKGENCQKNSTGFEKSKKWPENNLPVFYFQYPGDLDAR